MVILMGNLIEVAGNTSEFRCLYVCGSCVIQGIIGRSSSMGSIGTISSATCIGHFYVAFWPGEEKDGSRQDEWEDAMKLF